MRPLDPTDDPWANLIRARVLKGNNLPRIYIKSSIWPGIKTFWGMVCQNIFCLLGNCENISFWRDNWIPHNIPFSLNILIHLQPFLNSFVANFIVDGSWHLPPWFVQKSPSLAYEI